MEAKETNRTRKSPGARRMEHRRGSAEARQGTGGDGNIDNGSRAEDSEPPKLYHTLTACTRCRSVRNLLSVLGPNFLPIIDSGKPVAMQGYRSVDRVNGVGRIVNSSIQQNKKPYPGAMSFICKPRSGRWRRR